MDEKRKDADGSVRAMAVDEQAFWDAAVCAMLAGGARHAVGIAVVADALLAERRERMGRPV